MKKEINYVLGVLLVLVMLAGAFHLGTTRASMPGIETAETGNGKKYEITHDMDEEFTDQEIEKLNEIIEEASNEEKEELEFNLQENTFFGN